MAKHTLNQRQLDKLERRIGRTLRAVRMDLGYSMSDLACVAGVTHQQIYKIERGVNRLSLSRFYMFMRYFSLSPRSFYETAFGTDWDSGAQLKSTFKKRLFAIIQELSEEERALVFEDIMRFGFIRAAYSK